MSGKSKKKSERGFGSHNLPIREPFCEPLEPLRQGEGLFRPNVAGLILRPAGSGHDILLGERCDTPGAWQWPQGGMDRGETPEETLFRELKEEIGVDHPKILYRFPFLLRYRFPESLANRFKRWLGQEQAYFILSLAADDPADLTKASEEEFRELRWFPLQDAILSPVWFKEPVYQVVLNHVQEVLPELSFN